MKFNKTIFLLLPLTVLCSSCDNNKNIHIILIAGQSNAIGWSKVSDVESLEEYSEYKKTSDNQKIIFNNFGKELVPGLVNYNEDFEQVAYGQGLTDYQFGMEIGFSKILRDKHPNDKYYFIKYAMNSSTVIEDWKLDTDFYKGFISFVNSTVNKLKENNYKVSIDGLMWMQGENDADQYGEPDKYEERCITLFNDIRNNFNSEMIIVDAGISNCSEWIYYEQINESKKKLDQELTNHYYFDTIDMGLTCFDPSLMHYDGPSMLKLGEKFASIFFEHIKS